MYIVLFLVFMLLHKDEEAKDAFTLTVNRQIFVYIRGKTAIAAFVAGARDGASSAHTQRAQHAAHARSAHT
jgi:hypothetical protein